MFQPPAFRPIQGGGFLPPVAMHGLGAQRVQNRREQAFYPAVNLGRPLPAEQGFLPQVSLGQNTDTAQEWYERAKNAMAKYEFLVSRVPTVKSTSERDAINTWLGSASVPGTPQYRYTTVKSDFISDVAAEGVGAYNVDRRQNRVAELEDYNNEFNEKLMAAGADTYGRFETKVPVTTPAAGPDLTVPILVGAGAIALALIL